MTRRSLLLLAAAHTAAPDRLALPIHRVADSHARVPPERRSYFWSTVWPEAFRVLQRSGIDVQTEDAVGAILRSAADRPIFVGLRRDALNLICTDHIPMFWDRGRSLAGVTTVADGYHMCMIAMLYAHGNQVPYISTNTCVHELMHALLGDILVSHPTFYQVAGRESRVDYYATQMWLFGSSAYVRRSARAYLQRLRAATREE